MNDPLDKMDSDLGMAMKQNMQPNTSPHILTPKGVAQAVSEATNSDTDRTSRMMLEQHMKISEGLEKQIEEATQVRETITKYIGDLNTALNASKATVEVLTRK
jgi:hypothetical protein